MLSVIPSTHPYWPEVETRADNQGPLEGMHGLRRAEPATPHVPTSSPQRCLSHSQRPPPVPWSRVHQASCKLLECQEVPGPNCSASWG